MRGNVAERDRLRRGDIARSRDFERAWLPQTLSPASAVDIEMTMTAPAKPGRYGLKFDLVSEGVDWFETAGSPTITRGLWVS